MTTIERLRAPFSRGPEHCSMCGDAFVETTYSDGYRRDGSQIIGRWRHCPRSNDKRPSPFERYRHGRCTPLYPMSCANEQRAWNEHRPWWGACGHNSVSEDGSQCWTRDGQVITGIAAVAS
jgi:hypothetical protein